MYKVNRRIFNKGLFVRKQQNYAPQTRLFINPKMKQDKIEIETFKNNCAKYYYINSHFNYFQRIFGETIIPRKVLFDDKCYKYDEIYNILEDFWSKTEHKYSYSLQNMCQKKNQYIYYIIDPKQKKKEAKKDYIVNCQVNSLPRACNLVGNAIMSNFPIEHQNIEKKIKNMAISELYKIMFLEYLKHNNYKVDAMNSLNKYFEELRYNINCYRNDENDLLSLEKAFSKLISLSLYQKINNEEISSKKIVALLERNSLANLLYNYPIDNVGINEFMRNNDFYSYPKQK